LVYSQQQSRFGRPEPAAARVSNFSAGAPRQEYPNVIAKLTKFVPLSTGKPNKIDCAIAEVNARKLVAATVMPKVNRLKSSTPIAAQEGMNVEKTGRTTGYTTGVVHDISASVKVNYDIGTLVFDDQVIVYGAKGAFSDAGDSGSLIVDRATKRATALLFGGSSQYTIGNHIENVLNALGATLVI
jgi:Peptidase family S64